jgi:hypothetical protein
MADLSHPIQILKQARATLLAQPCHNPAQTEAKRKRLEGLDVAIVTLAASKKAAKAKVLPKPKGA